MASGLASHGRGGAGNMVSPKASPKLKPSGLETPTLKSAVVTTGRGGTGNMAKNSDPYETRKRQDVEAIPRRSSAGAQHAGRGGAGNIFKDDADAIEALGRITSHDNAVDDAPSLSAHESLATKGKNWLLGKKA